MRVSESLPSTGGTWLRTPERGLVPSDEPTARAAGIPWVPPDLVTTPEVVEIDPGTAQPVPQPEK